ncbi:MAG: HipA domain-containing protein [Candidatus Thiothrix putei]|uniref:HipA domain-containing protein n=1 Tax=Candidatus Thiothrix putei TaxID=3080811 RepID=A0AA95KJ75_9GAMM|nr:MAG: HipA domain-containing protein [Candidatus Thiothrix putei]
MKTDCTFELFLNGAWRSVGSMALLEAADKGWQGAAYLGYAVDHAIQYAGQRDATALSWTFPVNLTPLHSPHWPGFIMDLLPQGYGRQELLRQLALPERAETSADWALLLAGTGNPAGNCRVREAYDWLQSRNTAPPQGFSLQEVAQRGEQFAEHLANHGLFVAGSSGVQGEWPKLLLTENHAGQFFLDHTLPDAEAKQHWLVKFARGQDPHLNTILHLEAVWMELARFLGLRVHGALLLQERALFIPRFDRQRTPQGWQRHAQESLYALCQCSGFGARLSHNAACVALAAAATDPVSEIAEYLKRDIANVVLGNKDNHGRNTAIQRREDGWVGLTPLFDFAPMVLHPDGLARNMRWEADDYGSPDWRSAIRQAAAAAHLPEETLQQAVAVMIPPLTTLPDFMHHLGIAPATVERFTSACLNAAKQLEDCC